MADYVATFHTHLAALRSCRALTGAGVEARMAPVPRSLSSSCGTCVLYRGTSPMEESMDRDLEAVYRRESGGYRLVCGGEE